MILICLTMKQINHAYALDYTAFTITILALDQLDLMRMFLRLHAVIHDQTG